MGENGLAGAYSGRAPKGGDRPVRPPSAESVLARSFDGHAPRTHVAADLACVRAGGSWCCACPLVDPCNREIAGCSCGRRKDARLVKAAFSNVAFPLTAIEVFHGDRGSEFCNGDVDAPLSAFGIERSVSRPGNPCDNAVVESADRVLKRELESPPFPLTHRVPFGHDAVNGERGHGMGHPSPKYSAEFKQQAVRLYNERGTTYAEVARELGVDPGSLSDWVKRADAAQAPAGDNPFQMAEDLRRLRRENERLKRENEILLKASAFFASRQL